MPKGVIQTMTDYGKGGSGGACPPKGDSAHQYVITIHALDIATLGVDEKAQPTRRLYDQRSHHRQSICYSLLW
jgi:phosphatidylethanolamine-binding protein (PEBP) family uncharacterized protein